MTITLRLFHESVDSGCSLGPVMESITPRKDCEPASPCPPNRGRLTLSLRRDTETQRFLQKVAKVTKGLGIGVGHGVHRGGTETTERKERRIHGHEKARECTKNGASLLCPRTAKDTTGSELVFLPRAFFSVHFGNR